MITHTWEDRALGVTLALALAFGVALYAMRTTSITTEAVAAEKPVADYTMTITAQRLPRECKGMAETNMSATCRTILNQVTVSTTANR